MPSAAKAASSAIGNVFTQNTRRQSVRFAQNSCRQIYRRDLPSPRGTRDLPRGCDHSDGLLAEP